MSNNNDMKTEVIIPGNEKNDKNFFFVYKELMRSTAFQSGSPRFACNDTVELLEKKMAINSTIAVIMCRAFDVELLYIAQQMKMKMTEVSVNWKEIEGMTSYMYVVLLTPRGHTCAAVLINSI